jgi:uncharacterized membrane protein
MRSPTARRLDLPSALFAGLSILYPLAAVVGLRVAGPVPVLVVLVLLLCLRSALPIARDIPLAVGLAPLIVVGALALVAYFDVARALRLYPVFMNVVMLISFVVSLIHPPSIIERFARIMEPDLPPSGVAYTRRVTIVWSAFFVINGSIALWTALRGSWAVWSLYNGVVAYALMGLLFVVEYGVRQRVRRRDA